MLKLLIIVSAIIAAALTYYLSVDCKQGAVRASAGLSLLFALFLYVFPNLLEENLRQELVVVFIGASFVGMSGKAVLKNLLSTATAGLVFALIYMNTSQFFSGYGGGLGTIAFIAVLTIFGFQHYQLNKKGNVNTKKIILIVATLLLALFSLSWWMNQSNNGQLPSDPTPPQNQKPTVDTKCGFENCHGLKISCGPNIAEICTMVYMPGDGCRQFANCAIIDDGCQAVFTPEFEICKNCVESCEEEFAEQTDKFFECESQCVNSAI